MNFGDVNSESSILLLRQMSDCYFMQTLNCVFTRFENYKIALFLGWPVRSVQKYSKRTKISHMDIERRILSSVSLSFTSRDFLLCFFSISVLRIAVYHSRYSFRRRTSTLTEFDLVTQKIPIEQCFMNKIRGNEYCLCILSY